MTRLFIRSKHDGYRRAGVAFTRDGVTLDRRALTDQQLAAIEADPRLTIRDAPGEAAAAEAEAADEAMLDKLRAIAAALPADALKSDGSPKVAAFRAALAEAGIEMELSAAALDELWPKIAPPAEPGA